MGSVATKTVKLKQHGGKQAIIRAEDFDAELHEEIGVEAVSSKAPAPAAPRVVPPDVGPDVDLDEFLSYNASDAVDAVTSADTVDELNVMASAEKRGKARKTVLDAVIQRRAELKKGR